MSTLDRKDSEIIREARDLITDENSWTRGDWCHRGVDGVDRMCVMGAVGQALGLYRLITTIRHGMHWAWCGSTSHDERRADIGYKLRDTAAEMYPHLGQIGSMVALNDKYLTHQEILDVMDKTAAGLEEKGL